MRNLLFPFAVFLIGLSAGCTEKTIPSVKLDGAWLSRVDPSDTGRVEQWFRSDHQPVEWDPVKLREIGESLEPVPYNDAVWFAKRFESALEDSALVLLFERVYGELEVWLNGTRIGFARTQGDVYTVDLPGMLHTTANELVMRLGPGGEVYGPISIIPVEKLPDALRTSSSNRPARLSADWIRDAVVYEVSMRSFSGGGTFGAVKSRVEALRASGASVLLLSPIHPIGDVNRLGSLGSPYAVQDFYAVNPEFGTMEDFRDLVETVHRNEMKILIDMPASQAAWDSKLMFEHAEWFLKDESGAIISPHPQSTDVAGLNYNHHELRKYMIAVMEYWVRELGIDGYRFDGSGRVRTDFWEILRGRLENIRPVMMISDSPVPEQHVKGFDAAIGWSSYYAMQDILAGNAQASRLTDVLRNEQLRFPEGSLHVRVSTLPREPFWTSSGPKLLGSEEMKLLVAAGTFLIPGIPLVREDGNNKKLVDMRNGVTVMRRGGYVQLENSHEKSVTTFERRCGVDRAIVLLNWGSASTTVRVHPEALGETWRDYFDGELFQGDGVLAINLKPLSYRVILSEGAPQ